MGIERRGKDPHAWQLRVEEPRVAGEPRRRPVEIFYGTRKEAEARYAKLKELARRGTSVGSRGRTPFATFAELWLDDRRNQVMLRADDTLAPDTVRNDESRVRQHIIPALGKLRMLQIGVPEVKSALRTWKQTPLKRGKTGTLSPKSVSNLYIVLRKMLNDAVVWRYIEWNPCERVDAPPGGTRHVVATALEDAGKLLAYPSLAPVHVCCLTALFTGLRRGELLALRVDDVDLDQNTIWCTKSVATWDGRTISKDVKTKNDRGRRRQPLTPILATILRAYLVNNPGITGPLFAARGQAERWSDVVWSPRAYSAAEARHMAKLGIAASSQTLRHAFNSLQSLAGVDKTLRAVLMGHADSSRMTDVNYLTVVMEQKREAVDRLAELVAKVKPLPDFKWEEPPLS